MSTIPWRRLFALGATVSLTAACTVNSGDGSADDDDDGTSFTANNTSNTNSTSGSGGSGGSTTTTSGSGGSGGGAGETSTTTTTSTGGSGGSTTSGSGGTGGGGELECLMTDVPSGAPAPCENLDPDANSCCTLCAAARCCDTFSACQATNPANICGGTDGTNGEIGSIQSCMVEKDGLPGLAEGGDVDDCLGEAVNDVSSELCNAGTISLETGDLVECLHGDADGLGGCFEECFTDYDESACLFRD